MSCRMQKEEPSGSSLFSYLSVFAFQQLGQLRHEGVDILELAVHRGETDIGHFVYLTQLLHDLLTHHIGSDLPLKTVLQALFDLIGHLLQLRQRDRALLAGEMIGCHPCINTSSLRIGTKDLLDTVIPALGHAPTFVDLPTYQEE